MKNIAKTFSLLLFFCLGACSWQETADLLTFQKKPAYGNEQAYITLQQPMNRVVVTCYNSPDFSSERCAQIFEAKGYVRLRDIPYRTANYDFLQTDTYPTRRWREGELTPRW